MAGLSIGTQIGTVIDTSDPSGSGRVRVRIPMLSQELMALVCTPFGNIAGAGQPKIADQVVVTFISGDVQYPVVIGKVKG
ncbi:MAG: hypothetical protein JO055_05700 [Alphaproteobacteria bacterium]|nr:hypothetical protein [Alphaproteobacteria bacterium]